METAPYWIKRFELPSIRVKSFSEGWAIIVIDSKGLLSVWSDFGKYVYHWSSFGTNFPEFLLGLDDSYLAGKLLGHRKTVYDEVATLQAVRSALAEAKSSGTLTEDQVQEDLVSLRLYSEIYTQEDFYAWSNQANLRDAGEYMRFMLDPQLQGFLMHIWPRFKAALLDSGKDSGSGLYVPSSSVN